MKVHPAYRQAVADAKTTQKEAESLRLELEEKKTGQEIESLTRKVIAAEERRLKSPGGLPATQGGRGLDFREDDHRQPSNKHTLWRLRRAAAGRGEGGLRASRRLRSLTRLRMMVFTRNPFVPERVWDT